MFKLSVDGGITNLVMLVEGEKESVVLKVFGKSTEMFINRNREAKISGELADKGYGPRILLAFDGGRIEEYWSDSLPLSVEQMRDAGEEVAKEMAYFHSMFVPAEVNSIFEMVERFFSALEKLGDDSDLHASMKKSYDWLKSKTLHEMYSNIDSNPAFQEACRFAEELVSCHYDILSGNIMKSQTSGQIRFIDYEYSATGARFYDIANHFCEYGGFENDVYPDHKKRLRFIK